MDSDFSKIAVRKLAEHLIETSKKAQDLVLQQHADSFKWILASLLAVNSGGAFATLNSDKIDVYAKKIAGSFFSIGILLSILVAVVAQKLSARVLPILNEQVGFWISALEDGVVPPNLSEFEARNSSNASKYQWLVPTVGWFSAICFILGAITIGANLKPEASVQSPKEGELAVVGAEKVGCKP